MGSDDVSAGRVDRERSRAVPMGERQTKEEGRGRGIRRGGQATAVVRGRGGQRTDEYTWTAINGMSYIKTIHKHKY